jgi:hypothetical protein
MVMRFFNNLRVFNTAGWFDSRRLHQYIVYCHNIGQTSDQVKYAELKELA